VDLDELDREQLRSEVMGTDRRKWLQLVRVGVNAYADKPGRWISREFDSRTAFPLNRIRAAERH